MRIAIVMLLSLCVACSPTSTPTVITPPSIDPSILRARADRFVQLEQAVKSQPENAEAWGEFGQAFHALEFHDRAMICYSNALELNPQSGRWFYLLGIVQLRDEPDKGLTNLFRAVSLLPATNETPRLTLGKALAERGRTQDAAQQFETILSANPNHPAARLELARLKVASNETQLAADLLPPCLTNQYTAKPAHFLLGQVKLKLGDPMTAAKLAQRGSTLPEPFDWPDPFLRQMQNSLALDENVLDQANRLLSMGRFADAEKHLNSVLQQDGNDAEALLLLGRLRSQQQRFSEAESLFQKHLGLRTNSVQGWMQLGIIRFRQEQWAGAAEAFKKATEAKPDYAEGHANLAFAYSRQNQTDAAIQSFQTALRCQPGDARTHASLAEEYLRANRKTEALAAANAALAINPREPKALRILEGAK